MTFDELVDLAARSARTKDRGIAARWLRAVASLLADWSAPDGRAALKSALPRGCFRGGGTSGRSYDKALEAAGGDARVAIIEEAARRTHEDDPRNVAMTLVPLLGVVKEALARAGGDAAVATLVASLPAALHAEVRRASAAAPWTYRLIPQSYARPHDGAPAEREG